MIYSIGEMLIDFMQEENHYVPYPGGAPANVAIHAKRSGAKAQFVGKLSQDNFGNLLKEHLEDNNVYFPLKRSENPTALALVSHVEGERSFQFYRSNTADLDLSIEDIAMIPFKEHDILHFCSLGLVNGGTTYQAHLEAIKKAKDAKSYISFDVNIRPLLWDNLELAKDRVLQLVNEAHIVKVNEEELLWLTGMQDIEAAMKVLQSKNQVIICTKGKEGSSILRSDASYFKTSVPLVKQVDSTGAGDSYIAMILASLSSSNQDFTTWQNLLLQEAVEYATKISAQVVSHKGAIPIIEY